MRAPRAEGAGRHRERRNNHLSGALFSNRDPAVRVRKRRPDRAGRAARVAVIKVVDEMIVEIDGLLDEPQAERAETEVEIRLGFVDGCRHVMESENRHRWCYRKFMRLLGIAGSLRRGSYNRGLIEAARQLLPPSIAVEVFELDDIPLYNADYDVDGLRPFEVERFKSTIAEADAVLIATPEYNHSVPGVLQNAIDWASRPAMKSPLIGKPVAIMGASVGITGTARAQQQLKLVLMSTLASVMPHGGVFV